MEVTNVIRINIARFKNYICFIQPDLQWYVENFDKALALQKPAQSFC